MHPSSPQAQQMADESMVRNLAAQADAIWPQEEPIVRGYPVPATILDVGCGTGEITARLARVFPAAQIIGVDLIESHLAIARGRCAAFGDRVALQTGDAFELPFPAHAFDLVVCRHLLQAVPEPERVLAELVRVAKRGGRLHLIPEDYGMIHAAPARLDVAQFWFETPRAFGTATQTDLHIGRHIYHHLRKLPVDDIRFDYVAVDTLRVPRETFAAIFEAWRDGYVDGIAERTGRDPAVVRAHFEATIECIRDPERYALWLVPVVSCRVR